MKHWVPRLLLYTTSLLMVSACISPSDGASMAMPRAGEDHYTLSEQSAQSASGCRFDYRVYNPIQARTTTSILLGHGFLRNQNNMVGLSRELANSGIKVVTLNFCNMRPWNGHHLRNAQDMRSLAKDIGVENNVIYAGFSAGGLAAILAADDTTRAIVTLDLVDQNNLGLNALASLQAPLIGVAGPASACNAMGNGKDLFDSRPANLPTVLTEIAGASHCEFETPSNWLCEVACGDEGAKAADGVETDIIVRSIVRKIAPFLVQPQR